MSITIALGSLTALQLQSYLRTLLVSPRLHDPLALHDRWQAVYPKQNISAEDFVQMCREPNTYFARTDNVAWQENLARLFSEKRIGGRANYRAGPPPKRLDTFVPAARVAVTRLFPNAPCRPTDTPLIELINERLGPDES